MNLTEYDIMFQVEEQMWWYRGMEAITRAMLERAYARGGRARLLDCGCGTGAALRYLGDYGAVTGIDLEPYALQLARRRQPHALAAASALQLPFASATFDVVASLDVLPMLPPPADEHALAEMARLVRPGGHLLVRAAAYNWLRGAHDRIWHVHHRYGRAELCAKLEKAGLQVEHISHANMWLFPLAALKRLAEPLFPRQNQSDLALQAGALNAPLAALLASEARWVAQARLPFGLTLIALARRPH